MREFEKLPAIAALRSVWIVSFLSLCTMGTAVELQLPSGKLILTNGDRFVGQLRPTATANTVSWQADDFLDPFVFPANTIATIQFPTDSNHEPSGDFVIQCFSGDVITGDLVSWDQDSVVVRSESLGNVSIRIVEIEHLQRMASGGAARVSFATGLYDWQENSGWTEDGQDLITNQPNALLNGNFHIPHRLAMDIQLSWNGKPDFVFAVACDANRDTDSPQNGWRLETVGQHLTVIREEDQVADVAMVAELSPSAIIRLTLFLDQDSGQLWLFDSRGRRLANIHQQKSHRDGSGMRLVNRGESLKLERLRIWPWLGPLPSQSSDTPIRVEAAGGNSETGSSVSFDPEQQLMELQNGEESASIKLSQVLSVRFSDQRTKSTPANAVFRLRGGVQVSGEIKGVGPECWMVHSDQFSEDVRIPLDEVHVLTLSNSYSEKTDPFDAAPGSDRNGFRVARIEVGQSRHLGWIASADEEASREASTTDTDGRSAIWWQPIASDTACRLKSNVSGRIQYSAIVAVDRSRLAGGTPSHGGQIRRRENTDFGQLFLERVDRVEAKRARRDQHVVHLVCGDIIVCRVESIDDVGVYISTIAEENIQVPHAEIKAIQLVSKAALPELSLEKRQRLLTLPRLQKSEPPTHLLFSHDGDLLRCRLVSADQESIVVEVQMEELVIPSDRITHIVWLHPSDLSPDPLNQNHFNGMVQTVTSDGRRMTFSPTGTTKSEILGTSRILGECRVDLSKVQQITFGDRIADEATKLVYADWKLRPATEPLVMQDTQKDDPLESESPLVGNSAPPISLERLDGGEFKLSKQLGKILVVEFWASWCAPCMQTLPAISQAIADYDPQQVAFVAVNLEERREVVGDAVERLKLNMIVALDVDGMTADSYQATAIPQTVVIDSYGRIADVIIGGGQQAVERIKLTVGELLNSP